MQVGNLWIQLGFASKGLTDGLKEIEKDAKTFGSILSGTFKTAASSAQASLQSLSRIRIGDIARMPEFKSVIGEMRQLGLEHALLAEKAKLTASESEKLKMQLDYLNKTLALHRQGMAVAQQAYEKSIAEKGKDANETKRLQSELQRLQLGEARLENAVKQTEQALKSQAKTTSEAQKKTQSFGQTLKDVLKTAAGAAIGIAGFQGITAAIKNSIGAGIQFDAQMQQARISFETMLGNAEKAQSLLAQLQQFAAATPFEFPELQDAAKRMLAFGFAAEDIMPMLKATGDAAAGLGLSGSEGIGRIILALGQMKAKAKVSAEEMLQLTEVGVPAWDILAKTMGKSTAEVMKLSEKGLIPADQAIQALVKGMAERFPNMMDKQSKSFSGFLSTLRDNLNITFGTVVKPIFDWISNVALPQAIAMLEKFTSVLRTAGLTTALKTIIPAELVNAAISVGRAIEFMIGTVKTLAPVLVGAAASFAVFKVSLLISSVVGGLATAFATLREAILMYRSGVQLATTAQFAFNASLLTNPIGMIIAAIGVLVGVVYALHKAWADHANAVEDVTAELKKQLNTTQESIKQKQTEIAAINQQIQTLAELKNRYLVLSQATAQSELSDQQLAATKAQLAEVEQRLIPIIGQEGLEKIRQAENAEQAFNAEIQAMQDKLDAQKKAVEEARKLEFNQTMNLIEATEARIAAIEAEKNAYGIWSRTKIAFYEMMKKAEESMAGWMFLGEEAVAHHKEAAAALQERINDIIEASKAEPLAEARAELSKLRQQLISLGDTKLGGIDTGNWILSGTRVGDVLAGIGSTASEAGKSASKAAADTRAEWEKTADALSVRLQILQARYDLATARMGDAASEAELLALKNEYLSQQMDIQGQIVDALTKGYKETKEVKGEAAEETQKLYLRLVQEQKTQAELAKQLEETNKAIENQTSGLERLNQRMQVASLLYDIAQAQLGQNATEAEKLAVQHNHLSNLLNIQGQIVAKLNDEYNRSISEKGKDAKTTQELYAELLNAQKAQAELTTKLNDTNKAIAEQSQKLEEQKTKVSEAAAKYRQDMAAALADYQAKVEQAYQKLAEDEQKLTQEYENTVAQRARALVDWVSLFDAVPKKADVSGQQLLQNLQGQVDAFKDWQANVKALAERGIDQGLVAELEQMGPKASGEIAALLTLTDSELAQYVLLWREKNSLARQQATEELAGLQAETRAKIAELRTNTAVQLEQYRQEWEKKNQEIRDSTVKTLQDMVNEAAKQGAAFVQTLTKAINAALPGLYGALKGVPLPVTGEVKIVDQAKQAADQKEGVISEAKDQSVQHAVIAQGEMNALLGVWTQAGGQLAVKQQEIKTQTLTAWQEIQQRLFALWQKIYADLVKTWTDSRNFVFDVLRQVDERFKATENAAIGWGRNLMANFIAGIRSMQSALEEALLNIAKQVEGYLGFHSPTEFGPGRYADEWTPNLIKLMASGLEKELPKLQAASEKLIEAIKTPVVNVEATAPAVAVAGGGGISIETLNIYGSNAEEIWEQLERKLYRKGRW